MSDRRFSDDEVARILARAVELQEARRNAGDSTLTDIERAAAEAGIDPALVRDAAAELGSGSALVKQTADGQASQQPFFGHGSLSFEAHIDGVLNDADLAVIHDVLQATWDLPATASSFGSTVQWSHIDPQTTRSVMASVTRRDGRTVVRFHERLGGLMGAIYGGVGGGAGGGLVLPGCVIGGIAIAGPVGAVVGGVVGSALSLAGTRGLYRLLAARRERKLKAAFDAVVAEIKARTVVGAVDAADSSISSIADAKARQGLLPSPSASPFADDVSVDATVDADAAVRRR